MSREHELWVSTGPTVKPSGGDSFWQGENSYWERYGDIDFKPAAKRYPESKNPVKLFYTRALRADINHHSDRPCHSRSEGYSQLWNFYFARGIITDANARRWEREIGKLVRRDSRHPWELLSSERDALNRAVLGLSPFKSAMLMGGQKEKVFPDEPIMGYLFADECNRLKTLAHEITGAAVDNMIVHFSTHSLQDATYNEDHDFQRRAVSFANMVLSCYEREGHFIERKKGVDKIQIAAVTDKEGKFVFSLSYVPPGEREAMLSYAPATVLRWVEGGERTKIPHLGGEIEVCWAGQGKVSKPKIIALIKVADGENEPDDAKTTPSAKRKR